MSIWALATPAGAALPVAEGFVLALANASRSLLGLGAVAGLLMLFKPLLIGILRAALLVIRPRQTREQRGARQRLGAALLLGRMARRFDTEQPNQAAELRALASRD